MTTSISDLIPIRQYRLNSQTVRTIEARELHAFLEVKTRFNDWIARRTEEYGFSQDIDFAILKNEYNEINSFHISIDMAKELAMVEKTSKGRYARRYFIECERRLHAKRKRKTRMQLLEDIIEMKDEIYRLRVAAMETEHAKQLLNRPTKVIHVQKSDNPFESTGYQRDK